MESFYQMSALSSEASPGRLVTFNGLCVKKSTVPTLVESLLKIDPSKIPAGEDLEEVRRHEIALLMEGRLDRESSLKLLSCLEADTQGLKYLTGLMAARS